MLHPLLILVFWNLIVGKHILSCWLYQYLRSRWSRLFFVHTHVQAGLPQIFVFLQFCWRRGVGKGFFYQRIQCFRFLRLPFHVEVSICYPFFRVFLSFTICSNNANFKVVQTCTLMKGNVFPIYREKFFSTKH